MFYRKVVHVYEKSRTCFRKKSYVFFRSHIIEIRVDKKYTISIAQSQDQLFFQSFSGNRQDVIIYDNQKTILILITNRNEGNLLERIQTMKL
mgnify:FL=1